MQTLNVGAGRTETEYKDAEVQRRNDLVADSKSDANFFFWAAGLATIGTGLLPMRIIILVGIGAIDLLRAYGGSIVQSNPPTVRAAAAVWVIALVALGFAARGGQRWAFCAGIVLYGADMIPLIMMFSIGAFAVHFFFVLKWFQGQKALKDLKEAAISTV